MSDALSTEYETPETGHLKVRGVSRDAIDQRCLHVHFNFAPTDDEMRAFHELARVVQRANFPSGRQDPASWVLELLYDQEITSNKARDWLRKYIQYGVQDVLPDVRKW